MKDVALVGGGLANTLIALRLAEQRPELSVALVEQGPGLGGEHTWCFHEDDVSDATRAWLGPLLCHSWPHHDVRFPAYSRRLARPYHAIRSARLRARGEDLGRSVELLCGRTALRVEPTRVALDDGRELEARLVIDGRGPLPSGALALGYQKFLGRELELEAPHGLTGPLLMDARVAQRGGFRFLYLLPFAPTRVLVEDTLYAETPDLDAGTLRASIDEYVAAQGWRVSALQREEQGVLPLPLEGDLQAFLAEAPRDVPKAGLRAALFHATTGYSLPEAAAYAVDLAALPRERLTSAAVLDWQRARSRALWRRGRFLRLLNRMLFRAASPERRFRVLERFYRLPEPLVARFYAGRPTLADRVRLLTGRPPVPVFRALRCLRESRQPRQAA